jgi:hypothetical protein
MRRVIDVNELAPDGSAFAHLDDSRMSAGGEVLFSSGMDEPDGSYHDAVWLSRPSGELLRIARPGDAAPGLPDGYTFSTVGINCDEDPELYWYPRITSSGHILLNASVTYGSGPQIGGLWTGDPDRGLELAMASGDWVVDEETGEEHEIVGWSGVYEMNDAGQIGLIARSAEGRNIVLLISPACGACSAVDVAGNDCRVDSRDIIAVLSDFGTCGGIVPADTNSDGCVNIHDLTRVLSMFGTDCN